MLSTSNLNDWTKLALGKREKYIKSYETIEDPINPQIVFMTKANSAFPPVTVNVIGNKPTPDTIYIKYHCGRLTGEAAVPVTEYQLLLRRYLASPRVPFPEKYAVVDKGKIKESVMKGAYEALQDMLNDSKVLDSTAYTETNEGIEITFSKEELKAFTDMDGVEAIKFLFHCYECDVDPIELADEEEFITVEIPYTHENLTESSVKNKNLKNKKMSESITRKAKEKLNLLNDIVNFAYEYGEDEATSLFKQAFKKVTGDDLIDALNEEEK